MNGNRYSGGKAAYDRHEHIPDIPDNEAHERPLYDDPRLNNAENSNTRVVIGVACLFAVAWFVVKALGLI